MRRDDEHEQEEDERINVALRMDHARLCRRRAGRTRAGSRWWMSPRDGRTTMSPGLAADELDGGAAADGGLWAVGRGQQVGGRGGSAMGRSAGRMSVGGG